MRAGQFNAGGAAPLSCERRWHTRYPLQMRARLRLPGGRSLAAHTRDLSLDGACLLIDESEAPAQDLLVVELFAPYLGRSSPVEVRAVVTRRTEGGLAVGFLGGENHQVGDLLVRAARCRLEAEPATG